MSTNKTDNLELHSWEPMDPFMREEMNENFTRIDTAVGADREGNAAAQSALSSRIDHAIEETAVVKLAGPVSQASPGSLTLDLSGIDISQYAALLVLVNCWPTTGVSVNGGPTCTFYGENVIGLGFAWFYNDAAGSIDGASFFGPAITPRIGGGRTGMWANITTVNITGKGLGAIVYGFKA